MEYLDALIDSKAGLPSVRLELRRSSRVMMLAVPSCCSLLPSAATGPLLFRLTFPSEITFSMLSRFIGATKPILLDDASLVLD